MINLLGNEEFKPLVKNGTVIPNYYISEDGRIANLKTGKLMKVRNIYSKRSSRLEAQFLTLTVPNTLFDDYQYHQKNKNTVSFSVSIHRAVMETWRPIDKYPPVALKDGWNDVPEEWRQWVRDTALVDHIDDDPTNNHVNNLRWVTPRENSHYIKKQKGV